MSESTVVCKGVFAADRGKEALWNRARKRIPEELVERMLDFQAFCDRCEK